MPSPLQLDESGVLYQCIENSNDAVMLTDVRGTLFYVNKAWIRIFGFAKEETLGKTPRILRSKYQQEDFYKNMWTEILDPTKGFWKGELINRSKDGKEIPMLLTIAPFKDPRGALAGYMGIAIDLTEKKLRELELMRKDRLATIGVLAAGLAHETGTPLGTVRGRAELALGSLDADSPIREDLKIIIAQVDRLAEITRSLLALAIKSNYDTSGTTFVKEVLDNVYNMIRDKIETRKIAMKMQVSEDTKVTAPSDHLGQVVLNLLTNSLHAIETAIAEGRADGHTIDVTRKDRETHWEVSVQDTGCGIADKQIHDLFRPFFTTKEVGEGKGLGLAIAHQMIHSWGGSIHVESKVGRGTTVTIVLPKAK